MDIRKYGIVIAIAILTAIFIYAVADAIAPQTEWEDCGGYYKGLYEPVRAPGSPGYNCSAVPIDRAVEQACVDQEYNYQPVYDEYGCVESYECSTCYKEQQDREQQRRMIIFYTMLTLGLVSVIGGFMLPVGTVHEWVGLGFIVAGVISLFIGTAQYWGDLARIARPFVIAAELAVLLFIIYRKVAFTKTAVVKTKRKR